MGLDLSKTYSVKSNATRDMRKAVAKGEYTADQLEVVVVPAGHQIVMVKLPEAKPAKPKPTPQVAAMPGMTPMGFAPAPAAKPDGVPGGAAVTETDLPAPQRALLVHLLNATAHGDTPTAERVGKRLFWKAAAYESTTPHGLPPRQLPGVSNALRKRGLIELEWHEEGKRKGHGVALTAAGLAAAMEG